MMIAVRVVKQIIDIAFAGVFLYNMVFFIQTKRHKLALEGKSMTRRHWFTIVYCSTLVFLDVAFFTFVFIMLVSG